MNDTQKQAIQDAHQSLTNAINSLVGCAMFAPEHLRQRDLPALVTSMRESEQLFQESLEEAGIY